MNSKEQIRLSMKNRLAEMSPDGRQAASRMICESLAALERIRTCRTLGIFLSLPDEPDLRPLYTQLHCTLAIPFEENGAWAFREALDLKEVRPGSFGIRYPSLGNIIHPSSLDVILVPGRAFTPSGLRLGRGAGIYDQLLVLSPAWRIGVAFHCQILQQLPSEAHDQLMDELMTQPI